MAYIPLICNKSSDINLLLGDISTITPILTGDIIYFTGSYKAAGYVADNAVSPLVYKNFVFDNNNNFSLFYNSADMFFDLFNNYGGYYGDNIIIFNGSNTLGTNNYKISFIPQTALDGQHSVSPVYIDLVSSFSKFDYGSKYYGSWNSHLGDLSIAALWSGSGNTEMYVLAADASQVSISYLYDRETLSPFISGDIELIYDPINNDYWIINLDNTNLYLIRAEPSLSSPGNYDKYEISFDDIELQNALSNGDCYVDNFDDMGFYLAFLNTSGFAGYRYIHMNYDGTSYDEIILSGNMATETALNDPDAFISIKQVDGVFYSLLSNTNDMETYLLNPSSVPVQNPSFTRNAIGVKLECGNYCIPFIKQRKF